jgi:hypothetical protein
MGESAFNRTARYHSSSTANAYRLSAYGSPCEVPMPRRYQPAQLAAVIIGIGAAVIILILFRGVLP